MVMVLPKAMHAPMRIERLPAPMTDSTARTDRSGQLETLLRSNPLTRYAQDDAAVPPQPRFPEISLT